MEKKEKRKKTLLWCWVVGNIMRKVSLPDGKIKVLFQRINKGKITNFNPEEPLFSGVDILKSEESNEQSIKSVIEVLIDNIKIIKIKYQISSWFSKTIEENDDATKLLI